MNLSIIAVVGQNNELVNNIETIWNVPGYSKFFDKKTWGKTIVMDRQAYENLPNLLVNRKYVILSTTVDNYPQNSKVFMNFDKLIEYLKNLDEEVFIIGSDILHKKIISYVNTMYLIEFEDSCLDNYFSYFNKNEWKKRVLSKNKIDYNGKNINYKYVKYERK